jgi:EAL domain-containing protein (putative c-di-GMP-specific phosphodiesterase class I)
MKQTSTSAIACFGDVGSDAYFRNKKKTNVRDNVAKSTFVNESIHQSVIEYIMRLKNVDISNEAISELLLFNNVLITAAEVGCIHCKFVDIKYKLGKSVVADGDFYLYYQPIAYEHGDQTVYGAESLVRWCSDGVVIQPRDFIPLSESTGKICDIGQFVFEESCRKASEWNALKKAGEPKLRINVNVSPIQITRAFVAFILNTLVTYGITGDCVGIELTESFLIGTESISIVDELHANGIRISVDDFGTGYSCLAEIKNFAIDTIKIDKSFIGDICGFGASYHIVEAIIQLASRLGINTLAEGVETVEQKKLLKKMGCNSFQGYLISKPLNEYDFVEFIRKKTALDAGRF